MLELSHDDLARFRANVALARLTAEASTPAAAAAAAVGLQAQRWSAAALGVRTRTTSLTAADVEMARSQERTIVRGWFIRGTLHMVPSEDARWLTALLGPGEIAKATTRYRQLGLDAETLIAAERVIVDALSGSGTLTRAELGAILRRNGVAVETKGQALIHTLRNAALRGRICYGPDRDGTETFVLLDDWLGPPSGAARVPGREPLACELLRRYLRCYGPATPRDFQTWSGLSAADAKAAFTESEHGFVEVRASGWTGWLHEDRVSMARAVASLPPVTALIPAFDSYLLGWDDRLHSVHPVHDRRIRPGGGIIAPALVDDGWAVATWAWKSHGAERATLTVSPFGVLGDRVANRLAGEVEDVGRFLGRSTNLVLESPGA